MKEITVLSGKGGTGKTTITAALASIAEKSIFCDNDVDAADLHLIFHPEVLEQHKFSSGWKAFIDVDKCSDCGACLELCRFDAIAYNDLNTLQVNEFKCEGCRLCERICEEQAIHSEQSMNNYWYVSDTRFGKMVHAKMGPGEENSGKLVSIVRNKAREIAKETGASYIINDGPPGIGCAAISSISGTDLVLLVVEPTKSGLHDAKRLIELIESFNIKTCAIINKHNINNEMTQKIEQFLDHQSVPLLNKTPFNKHVVEAMVHGKTIVEYQPKSIIAEELTQVWNKLKENL